MFLPEFKVITANSVEEAMQSLKEGGYEAVVVVGVKATSLPDIPMTRRFAKEGIADLLTTILTDITADAGGKVNAD